MGIVTTALSSVPKLFFPILLAAFRGEGQCGDPCAVVLPSFWLPSCHVHMALPLPSALMSGGETCQYMIRLHLWGKVERERVWFCLIIWAWYGQCVNVLVICMTCCLSERQSNSRHPALHSGLGREGGTQVVEHLSDDFDSSVKIREVALCDTRFAAVPC